MRVVPIADADKSTEFIGDDIYIQYPTGITSAPFNTNKVISGTSEREFKVYVVSDTSDLTSVEIMGTQLELHKAGSTAEADGIDESVDTNNADYSVLEVEYLYNGH